MCVLHFQGCYLSPLERVWLTQFVRRPAVELVYRPVSPQCREAVRRQGEHPGDRGAWPGGGGEGLIVVRAKERTDQVTPELCSQVFLPVVVAAGEGRALVAHLRFLWQFLQTEASAAPQLRRERRDTIHSHKEVRYKCPYSHRLLIDG